MCLKDRKVFAPELMISLNGSLGLLHQNEILRPSGIEVNNKWVPLENEREYVSALLKAVGGNPGKKKYVRGPKIKLVSLSNPRQVPN